MGDLNESNVLVTPTALVAVIDCDSFQVQAVRGGRVVTYPCPVGKLAIRKPSQVDAAAAARIQHLYGQLYGFKAGFTFGVFEDPDSWPDTVDDEGPNAVLSRGRLPNIPMCSENWNTTLGVEKPDIFVDLELGHGTSTLTPMPDLGFNTRYEQAGLGHMQFSALFRQSRKGRLRE